jgi:hypothetical protein
MNKDLKPHEIEFNEAIRGVELALNSMKLNGVHAQDFMYHSILMNLTKASWILSKEVNTRGYRNEE